MAWGVTLSQIRSVCSWSVTLPLCPAPEPQRPSYVKRVVLQVAQQRLWEWQLLGASGVSVDGEARQVLQRGEGLWFVQGLHQLQRHAAVFRRELGRVGLGFGLDVIGRLTLRRVAQAHVVLYEAENIREGLQLRQARGNGVQPEGALAVLDAYAGRPTAGLHRQGQHVLRVTAVTHQKRAFRLFQQSLPSFTG